jgi:hypothetical protein
MQNISIPLTMKPLNIKLYDIARTKMSFNDDDAMEFVSSIHELNDHRFENLVTKEFLSEKIHGTDQRFVKLDSNIDLRFTTLESKIDQRFITFESAIDLRFTTLESAIDLRFTTLESKIDQRFTTSQAAIDLRFTTLESTIDQRFTTSQASNNLQFNEIKTSFSSKISETKSELIKWMFIFWTGQITITIGMILLFVKS